ncbi:hypothetical protein [Psychrobacter sp. VH5]|uniref:hypothetical protein n=2 Tax=Psychrobacter TaxID=497 RepID=UPI003D64DF9D
MSEIVNWIGSICSILGAIYALRQANVAKKAANLAQSIKHQLISHRKTSELSELQALLNAAQKAFNKYGSSNPKGLAGISHNLDAEVVLDFINKLKSFRDYFSDDSTNVADETYNEIYLELIEFKKASSVKKISEHGSNILNIVVGFSPNLKRELTDQKESIVE